MTQDELRGAYERHRGSQGRPETLLAAARRHAAQRWLGGIVEGLTTLQVDEILELACHDAACAPPPAGRGGSLPQGWRKGAEMLEDDDSGEVISHLQTSSVGFLGVDNSDEHHGRWESAREGFRSSTGKLSGPLPKIKRWQDNRQDDMVEAYGHREKVGPNEIYASQIHVRETGFDNPKAINDRNPVAIKYGGKTYLMDGHHRVVSKWAKGEKAEIDIVDLERLEEALTAGAEELACHDASCAPPPVGTGGSKSAGASGTVETILRRGTTAERVAFAESLFNHELPHGCSSRIKSDQFEDGILANPNNNVTELFMEGKIVDQHGEHIGHFERHVEIERDGSLTAHHDTLVIDPAWHGVGLAQSFTSQSIDQYAKIGVEKIEVLAAMEVGAFAWARQGYQFDTGPTGKHEAIRKQWVEDRLLWVKKVADEGTKDRWSQDDAQQMKKAAQDLINASNRGESVQPIHVASLGEDRFRWNATGYTLGAEGLSQEFQYETWPGKEVLLNWNQGNPERGDPSWSGVKYINRDDQQVAASAETEDFYSPTQPRDKEGQWTRLSGYGSTTDSVGVRNYEGKAVRNAEDYKFHGPRHVADSMDPELRAKVTADLLTRNFKSGEMPGNTEEYIRDLGFINGGTPPIGLAFQVAHLYETLNDPASVGWDWKKVDQIKGLIADYDTGVMNDAGAAMKKASDEGTVPGPESDAMKASRAAELHDAIYKLTGVDATTGLIGAINRSWQVSASDTISVAAHLTVAKTHDVDSGRETLATYMRGDRLTKADAVIEYIGEANMKAVTDAVYAVTQRELSRLFPGETLTIHRGVTTDASIITSEWIKPSPLSSWSTDSATASDFAGEDGWTMQIRNVPHANIYSLATITGMGSLSEQEVILIGHEQKAEVFGPNDYD